MGHKGLDTHSHTAEEFIYLLKPHQTASLRGGFATKQSRNYLRQN